MLRLRSFGLASFAAAVALGIAPMASAAAAPPARAYSCAQGHFCIYSDWNGGGTRCQWSQQSKANTADDCSFIQRGQNVRSVRNNTGHRVQYYTQTNFHSRVGSTPSGGEGNLQGNYQIRSFKKQ
ncbi:peptidase inhibitor family I36 protein [Streptomyces subrutilus]|uniref:Peptidase inhibitor n=1 Tax=Streptomyces subrutilus TaxID=36818 RepID=A0A5P2UFE6_9ACTN|nr:peptidase inhibitor family I36 protein [Streptomyces subrutilus]QEU77185.1 peptidase inhibitor [Streptomyces subrutilus]WSJ33848.1 peptidase inhibitor family I36 protein [Streptomyces subrutilus]GGZ45278.1 hypothetical protein GCM10010371_00300 [Streptomyces subrutilus]